jgi:hypothetical protein
VSGSARGATRERKVAARLREIDRDRRALRNALDRFDGPQHFAATWASEDPDEINLRDQVERPYERIVNDLHELIDLCESEEAAQGVAPPTVETDPPGRWRRVAMRGHLSHARAGRWREIAAGRQRLQHHYADLAARQGAEIFERAHQLADELPRTIAGLGRWIALLWPERTLSG